MPGLRPGTGAVFFINPFLRLVATLVASLADASPQADSSYNLRIDQGVAMDRPSLLDATARKEHGKVTEVSVGGRATIIGHGIITIPGQEPAD